MSNFSNIEKVLQGIEKFQLYKTAQKDNASKTELTRMRRVAYGGIIDHTEVLRHLSLALAFSPNLGMRYGQRAGVRYSVGRRFDRMYFDKPYGPVEVRSPQIRPSERLLMLDVKMKDILPEGNSDRPIVVGLLEPGVRVDLKHHREVKTAFAAQEWVGQTRIAKASQFIGAVTLANADEKEWMQHGWVEPTLPVQFTTEAVGLDEGGRAVADVSLVETGHIFEGRARLVIDGLTSDVISDVVQTA